MRETSKGNDRRPRIEGKKKNWEERLWKERRNNTNNRKKEINQTQIWKQEKNNEEREGNGERDNKQRKERTKE
jgi:hypothetical protein